MHTQIWIAKSDFLVRRMTVEEVEKDDDHRGLVAYMRRSGLPEEGIDSMRRYPRWDFFSTTTYRPSCNEPIAPQALRHKDRSL